MKLPDLFRREKPRAAPGLSSPQDQAERLLVDALRFLSQMSSRLANLIEDQQLQRRGHEPQGKWLERLDSSDETSTRER